MYTLKTGDHLAPTLRFKTEHIIFGKVLSKLKVPSKITYHRIDFSLLQPLQGPILCHRKV